MLKLAVIKMGLLVQTSRRSLILKELITECGKLGELPTEIVSEENLRAQVIEAHKVLMSLNENNRDEFRDLVEALENEEQNEGHGDNPVPRNRVA